MKTRFPFQYVMILLLSIILVSGCGQQAYQEKVPEATYGNLDLSSWDLSKDGIVKLSGSWEFYWEQLIDPEDFSNNSTMTPEFITLPSAWKEDGYATYRLLIRTQHHNKSLALDIPKMSTAYKLWINDDLLASSGSVGITADTSLPHSQPKIVFFNSNQGDLELIIQLSNFHHANGGILENLKLGTKEQIKLNENRYIAFDLFVFGSLFVVGMYHLILYFYRRNERSNLYFGVFCTMVGIRTLFVGKLFIFQLLPDFNWEVALKIEYLSFYLGTPVFVLYLKSVLSKEISTKAIQLSFTVSFIFSLLVLFYPVKVYAKYNVFFQIFAILIIIYLLYALALACIRKREGAIAIGLAVVLFVSTIINDILYESTLIYFNIKLVSTNLSSWGFLVFLLSQSILLSRKFTSAFFKVEEMTANLKQLNESLEDKVLERTIALETSNEKLEKAYLDISNMEKSRTELLTNISHDLRSPMASVLGYANAILDGIVENPEQQKKYLLRIKERINGLNHLTQELFDLTQLESRKLKLSVQVFSVENFIQKVYKKYLHDVQNIGVNFNLSSPNTHPYSTDSLFVEVDIDRIDRAFANIIFNAIKYTPKDGTITLNYLINTIDTKPSEVIFTITDNGSGINTKDLPNVFNRFFTGSKSRTAGEGTGLGLAITKEIVEYHNGRIWVTSNPGIETTFYLSLPLINYLDE